MCVDAGKKGIMRDFVICTDTSAGLPAEYISENNISIFPLHYIIDGVEYGMDLGKELTINEFYQEVKNGKLPTTSATNPGYIETVMREILDAGKDLVYIAFSSGLSSTYSNANMVAEQLKDDYPNSKIYVIDTLSAECGQALLVYRAVEMKKAGKSCDEIAKWVMGIRDNMVVHFTLADLFHLVRGGRLSKTSAVLGTALNIQPVLHINYKGGLENISKARGRKKAMRALVDSMEGNTEGFEVNEVFFSHSDCEDECRELEAMVKEKYPNVKTMILNISPTVGSHTGCGTLVISYFGNVK